LARKDRYWRDRDRNAEEAARLEPWTKRGVGAARAESPAAESDAPMGRGDYARSPRVCELSTTDRSARPNPR